MERVEVAIVGAGPVGLTLACLLASRGISVRVFESRTSSSLHSRAIGLHPPAIRVLSRLGLDTEICQNAIPICRGRVHLDGRWVGSLALPDPPLSLPQSCTEKLLRERLNVLAPQTLRTGVTVVGVQQNSDEVIVSLDDGAEVSARLVVGCDGSRSLVRGWAGISGRHSALPDRYMMGDFADQSALGNDAALYFGTDGVVESFPLPGGLRRWVVWLANPDPSADVSSLCRLVERRTGYELGRESCTWLSRFGIERYHASTYIKGRVALAGDSAHVVSPIGGQGMNIGILGAAALADAWDGSPNSLLEPLERHRKSATVVDRRATFNTAMGRPISPVSLKRALILLATQSPPVARLFAHIFTMNDL